MIDSYSAVAVVYLIGSIGIFCACYRLARYFSGSRFKECWFWLCLAMTLVIGVAHLEVFFTGSITVAGQPLIAIAENDLARIVALVAVLLQLACIPGEKAPRQWLSKQ